MIVTLDSEARAFAAANPTRDGDTWHLFCGSLMWRMCNMYGTVPRPVPSTARLAADAAGTLNKDFKAAPRGAFHYWNIGSDGHVGLDTTGGGINVFMASMILREELGDAIGFQSVEGYTRAGISPYRGWSMFYGKGGKVNIPPLPTAMQYCIDKGLIDGNGDLNRTVDMNTLCWFAVKLLKFLGKA